MRKISSAILLFVLGMATLAVWASMFFDRPDHHHTLEREYREADQALESIGDIREGLRELRKKRQSPER